MPGLSIDPLSATDGQTPIRRLTVPFRSMGVSKGYCDVLGKFASYQGMGWLHSRYL